MTSSGPVGLKDSDFHIEAKLQYEGNSDYLPRTVSEAENTEGLPVISYSYTVGYGKDAVSDLLPLFNPLSLVGFPIGSDSIAIVGFLEIKREEKLLKQYRATCLINKTRNLFYEGDTYSELRRNGLLMVRDDIEAQMLNDKIFLTNLVQ